MTRADTALHYSKAVERYAHFFDRPDLRLRFLNNTLAKQAASKERFDRALERFPHLKASPFYGQLLDFWLHGLIYQELSALQPSAAQQHRALLRPSNAPLGARLLFACYQHRRAAAAACAALVLAAAFGLQHVAVRSAGRVNDYLAARYGAKRAPATFAPAAAARAAETVKHLPDYRPEKVWLVERKENYERYSNGARILLDYETANHPRAYYQLARGRLLPSGEVKREPAGIVYHTSESDMLPFTPDNNDSIEQRSRGLLEYVRRNRSYNYLIDRFGQIYRVVRDADAANHAGNSVWADRRGVYVGLNESFVGVSFETKMEAGGDERLSEAQLVAGRLLTQVLRSRYQIDDANCVTHGLVSVNPGKMLICFHHDWARNFPFEAFGLSDKYKVAPASVAEFGFTYDDEVTDKLGGELWPGVKAAEEEFARRSAAADLEPGEMRRQMQARFLEQMNLTLRLRNSSTAKESETSGASDAPAPPGPRAGAGAD